MAGEKHIPSLRCAVHSVIGSIGIRVPCETIPDADADVDANANANANANDDADSYADADGNAIAMEM